MNQRRYSPQKEVVNVTLIDEQKNILWSGNVIIQTTEFVTQLHLIANQMFVVFGRDELYQLAKVHDVGLRSARSERIVWLEEVCLSVLTSIWNRVIVNPSELDWEAAP